LIGPIRRTTIVLAVRWIVRCTVPFGSTTKVFGSIVYPPPPSFASASAAS
jgi:hypothetical protein